MRWLFGRRTQYLLILPAAVAVWYWRKRPLGRSVTLPAAASRPPELRPVASRPPAPTTAPAPRPAEEPVPQPAPAPGQVADGPFGPGSAQPSADGSAPSPDLTIKGNAKSMLYHTPASPYYGRTKAEVWFRSEEDAQRAGFTAWAPRRAAARRSG